MSAFDAFLEIEGIPGETEDAEHKGQIDVYSWSWGATNSGSAGSGGGGGAGKVSVQDIHFMKRVDKASPQLFLACATGQHIKSAKLFVRKQGTDQHDYFVITLSDIVISSFSENGASGDPPSEEIAFRFRRIQMAYTVQDATGAAGQVVTAGWDLATNKKV